MIGKQYLKPTVLHHLKHQAQLFVDKNLQPHLSDVSGSLLSIVQSLEAISDSLTKIAESRSSGSENMNTLLLRRIYGSTTLHGYRDQILFAWMKGEVSRDWVLTAPVHEIKNWAEQANEGEE